MSMSVFLTVVLVRGEQLTAIRYLQRSRMVHAGRLWRIRQILQIGVGYVLAQESAEAVEAEKPVLGYAEFAEVAEARVEEELQHLFRADAGRVHDGRH